MQDDPLVLITRRWLEAFQQETSLLINRLIADGLNPARLADIIRSLGIDASQMSGIFSRQPGFDPYRVLGLDPSATDEEVKKRYRELLTGLHPDTAGVKGTDFLLQIVVDAYQQIARERSW